MDLPIFKKKDDQPELFWSLVVGKNWIDSGIWRIVDSKTQVVARGGSFSWQEGNLDTFIEAVDSSLSAAAPHIDPEGQEPDKVVFGLPHTWIENGEIKKENLETLRKLSKELELSPAGFVVLPEALVHYHKAKEGSPLNAILVGLSEESIDVTIASSGKIVGTIEVGRSMALSTDVVEAINQLPPVHLYPTRIIIYGHKETDMESARQNLLDTEWSNLSITFLHTPKVEILPPDAALYAVSLAGGAEVGNATGLLDTTAPISGKPEEKTENTEKPSESNTQDFGLEEAANTKNLIPEDLGFLRGVDIATQVGLEPKLTDTTPPPQTSLNTNNTSPHTTRKKRNIFPQFSNPFRGVTNVLPTGLSRIIVICLSCLLLLGIIYVFIPKAEVTVFVSPKKIDKNIDFTIETGLSEVNSSDAKVPGRYVETSISKTKEKATTGVKAVGEPARGTVTIYRVGTQITIPKGTALSSNNNLKFTLDEDVKVASGSAGPDTLGKNTQPAKLTASLIGAEYNLAAGTNFKVGNIAMDTTTAKNDQAFIGGVSREVPAVSATDRKNLLKEVEDELKNDGITQLKGELADDEIALTEGSVIVLEKQEFSHKTNEETQTLTLAAVGKIKYIVVSKKDLQTLAYERIKLEVPTSFSLKKEQIQINVTKNEDNYTALTESHLLPIINPDEIAQKIAGKKSQTAKEYLLKIPGYEKADIRIKFPTLGTLPLLKKNISIEAQAQTQ